MSSQYEDHNHYRTTWNIILSCVTTLFVCAWVAIHPNVSYPLDKQQSPVSKRYLHSMNKLFWEKMFIIFIMLIFPEALVAWAAKQYLVASSIAKSQDRTRAHGFLVIMGGFYFYDGFAPLGPLSPENVRDLVQRDEIDLPLVDEIKDKSKGGTLIKVFALIQGFWFIIQCIARASRSLHVAKVEIVTAAYVMVTTCTYFVWWDKPQMVDQPIRVPHSLNRNKNPPTRKARIDKFLDWLENVYSIILPSDDIEFFDLVNRKQVPMFYSGDSTPDQSFSAWFISWFVGGVFSAILCITWSYQSSSLAELVIWRLCCLSGVYFFILFLACALIYNYLDSLDIGRWGFNSAWSELFAGLFAMFLVILYVISRVATIFLAMKDLTKSPVGTYKVVYWTDFIPHI